jgi:hypothetical protein
LVQWLIEGSIENGAHALTSLSVTELNSTKCEL